MLPAYLSFLIGTGDTDQTVPVRLPTVATFATYAVGMALPLLAVAVALALGKDAAVRRIRGMARCTTRAAGGLLVLAGGYIVFYWASVLVPDDRGPGGASGVLTTGMETLSSWLTTVIGARPLLTAAVLLGVIGAAAGSVWRNRRQSEGTDQPPHVSHTRPRDT